MGGLRRGVEPICTVPTEHGCPIAPTTYYAALARARTPSARERRDEALKAEISRVYGENYRVYGARKVWLVLNREGIRVARCTVERLMSELGLVGARRGRRVRTTTADPAAARPADLLERNFNPPAPNLYWFNHRRLFEACGDIPPAELEAAYYRQQTALAEVCHSTA